jgi:2',3'-cyclic-nucleotide 2'-phosphodiesterase (5'-nucleotidase family)
LPSVIADAVAKAGIPIVASNLRCDATRQALCARIRRELIIERGTERVGILGVLSPATLPSIAKPRRAGLELEPLATAIPAGVARLRASGATFVVVMVQVSSGTIGFEEVLALQRGLPRGGVPDLILASGTADVDGQRPTVLVRQDGSPPIVGSAGGTIGVTRVLVRPLVGPALAPDDAPVVDATLVRSRVEERDEATAQLLAHYVESYCERYSVAIGGTGVPTTKDKLLAYALAVMQRETRAEAAFVNGGLVYGPAFPLVGRLTRAKLKRAMPHLAVVGTVSVPGATLGDLLAAAEGTGRMVFAGAARPAPGKPFQINGRPIDKARSYRVATIDFVAQGGLLGDQLKGWKPWQGHPDIRDLVEAELALGSTFDTPASQKFLTTAIGDLAVDLTNTSITNTSMLPDAQLVRAQQRALKLEVTGLIQLDHPAHRWDTRATLKYGYARTQPVGKDAAAQETQDLVQLTSQYSYRGLVHPGSSAAIPSPYTRILFETELTQPGMRSYRHAELTHTAGALFTTFKTRLKLRAGGGYRTELLADADSADPDEAQVGGVRGVVEAGATLDPFAVATIRRLSITVEGSVDYFLLEPFGRTEHQTRASGKLSLPLLPLLFVTAGFDVFLVDRETAGRGASFDTTIGLKLHLDGAYQSL